MSALTLDQCEVVVIGGGVMGVSCAFHLAEAGVAPVVLVEMGELGSGSTRRAAGGVRAQFSDSTNVQLGLRSLEAFATFRDRPGGEIDLRRVGYLFLLREPQDIPRFEASIALQGELGVNSRLIAPSEAKSLSPLVAVEKVAAAAFSPDDGYCTPEAVVQGYAAGARRHGAVLETASEVVGIKVVDGCITGVVTTRGEIKTNAVICTAGAWSAAVGQMVGCQLDVTPLRRQVVFTGPVEGVGPEPFPMTIDYTSSFYFHREGPGVLMGMSDPEELPGFNMDRDDEWLPRLLDAAEAVAPDLAGAAIRGGWAGLYEVTPDHNALIGEAPGPSRFLYATGFSGHGFMQAPAVGEVVRDLYLNQEPSIDVTPLVATRFASQELRPELNVV